MIAKPWYTSKTVWLNILSLVGIVLAYLITEPTLQHVAVPLSILMNVLNIVLRFVTTQPVTVPGQVQ